MNLKIVVTQQDINESSRKNIFACAFVKAISKHFPNHFVSVFPTKVYSIDGPVMEILADGTKREVVIGMTRIFISIPPTMNEAFDVEGDGRLRNELIKETPEYVSLAKRFKEEYHRLLKFKGTIQSKDWEWAQRFDRQQLTPEDVPFTFNLEVEEVKA